MGYTTDFSGQFNLDKPLSAEHKAYLDAFNGTRRMKRNAAKLGPDSLREAAKLPAGKEGGYYVGSTRDYGQGRTPDVIDYNSPPEGQPSLWCQWVPNESGTAIVWDDGENFYSYVEWIQYLIDHFLEPWGYVVNGAVEWVGEDHDDLGRILVTANAVEAQEGKVGLSVIARWHKDPSILSHLRPVDSRDPGTRRKLPLGHPASVPL